jgi:hypothetical protein
MAKLEYLDNPNKQNLDTQIYFLNAIVGGVSPDFQVYQSLGQNVLSLVKTGYSTVLGVYGDNLVAGSRWLQVWDNNASAASGTLKISLRLEPGKNNYMGTDILGSRGIIFNSGIVVALSSTPLTYTAATATDAIVRINYQ